MHKSRRRRGSIGANGPRIRRPGQTANRLGSSRYTETPRQSPDSASARIIGERARLIGDASGIYRSRRALARVGRMESESGGPGRRPIAYGPPEFRVIPAIAGVGLRTQSRRKGEIMRGRSGNVQKSAETRAGGENVPRIRRAGSSSIRLGYVPRLRRFRRPSCVCFAPGVGFGRSAAAFR